LNDSWNNGESPQLYPVDTGRLRRVIETSTREADWGRKLPKGSGLAWPLIAALPATPPL
jgi:isoquinoline 1-oxidoreductase beta subunit